MTTTRHSRRWEDVSTVDKADTQGPPLSSYIIRRHRDNMEHRTRSPRYIALGRWTTKNQFARGGWVGIELKISAVSRFWDSLVLSRGRNCYVPEESHEQ